MDTELNSITTSGILPEAELLRAVPENYIMRQMFPDPLLETLPRPTPRSVLGVPLRLQTYWNILYLALTIPLGFLYFLFFVVGFSLVAELIITVIGLPISLPIILVVLVISMGLGTVERKLTTKLLNIDIEPPDNSPLSFADDRSIFERIKILVISLEAWKAALYLISKCVLALVSFILFTLLSVTVAFLWTPFVYNEPGANIGIALEKPMTLHPTISYGWDNFIVGIRTVIKLTSFHPTTLPEALLVAGIGVVLSVIGLNVLNALAWLFGRYARIMLGTPSDK